MPYRLEWTCTKAGGAAVNLGQVSLSLHTGTHTDAPYHFDDAGARMGYCLYKVGCKGPVTYNACSATRWNDGLSFPIQSGHGCIGCSEEDFWDKGSFYEHLPTIKVPGLGVEGTADRIGLTALAAAGVAVAAHAAVSAVKQARSKSSNDKLAETEK